jgi:hypothetical protein
MAVKAYMLKAPNWRLSWLPPGRRAPGLARGRASFATGLARGRASFATGHPLLVRWDGLVDDVEEVVCTRVAYEAELALEVGDQRVEIAV